MTAIAELRALIARPDGRIKHLYDVAEKALIELDRDYMPRPPPPSPSADFIPLTPAQIAELSLSGRRL